MSYLTSNLISSLKKCVKNVLYQYKFAMWKMQSLERTLTLAQLVPFFMLSPKGLWHQWNYKHEFLIKKSLPYMLYLICSFAIMNEMCSKCAKIVVCTYIYVQFAILLMMRFNILFVNLWKSSSLKCFNCKMTFYSFRFYFITCLLLQLFLYSFNNK
jgi:hypothetical protein